MLAYRLYYESFEDRSFSKDRVKFFIIFFFLLHSFDFRYVIIMLLGDVLHFIYKKTWK